MGVEGGHRWRPGDLQKAGKKKHQLRTAARKQTGIQTTEERKATPGFNVAHCTNSRGERDMRKKRQTVHLQYS